MLHKQKEQMEKKIARDRRPGILSLNSSWWLTAKPLKPTGKMREKIRKGRWVATVVCMCAGAKSEWMTFSSSSKGWKKVLIINIWKAFNIFMPFVHDYRVKFLRMLMVDKCWMLDEFQFFFCDAAAKHCFVRQNSFDVAARDAQGSGIEVKILLFHFCKVLQFMSKEKMWKWEKCLKNRWIVKIWDHRLRVLYDRVDTQWAWLWWQVELVHIAKSSYWNCNREWAGV